MRANDKHKLKVINFIDKVAPQLKQTAYSRELNDMRRRYIYKDISTGELKKDVEYLKNIKKLWR